MHVHTISQHLPLENQAALVDNSGASRGIACPSWESVKRFAIKAFQFFEDILWKCIDELSSLAGKVIQLVADACAHLKEKLDAVIAKMGMLSIINGLLTLKAIPYEVQSLIAHIKLKDGEGIAFSILNLITSPFELLDSLITTMEGFAAFGVLPVVALFGLISLPLAIGLIGFSAFKGLYDTIRMSIHLHALPKTLTANNLERFERCIIRKIDVTEKEKEQAKIASESHASCTSDEIKQVYEREIQLIKDRKKSLFIRQTDEKVYAIMVDLQQHLQSQPADLQRANDALANMRKILVRKITLNTIGVACNVSMAVAYAVSLATPILPFSLPIIGGIRSGFALTKHLFETVTS